MIISNSRIITGTSPNGLNGVLELEKTSLIFDSKMKVAVNKDIKTDGKRIYVHTYYHLRLQAGSQHRLAATSGNSRTAISTQNSAKQIAFILFYF